MPDSVQSQLNTPEAHGGAIPLPPPQPPASAPPLALPPTAPPATHNASSIVDNSALPPTLTPATTTRQSVALGVLSTLWRSSSNSTLNAQSQLPDPSIPSIITHAASPDTPDPSSDLTTTSGSVPSTTPTLTNTLPPTQSAALRALNAPAFHSTSTKSKAAKSTSSKTSLSSQPVVVRTYSGSRHNSRPSSGLNTPRSFAAMNGQLSQNPSALSAGLAGRTEQLPSVDDFSFTAILRAVDPEIRDAIDAIAEICARSRMSLADEYDAHLPPQGEITGAGPGWPAGMGSLVGRGRVSRINQGWTAAENTLTAVPEASSSSERLAGGSLRGTSKKRSQSAYGSLKSVISGGSGRRRMANDGAPENQEAGTSSRQEEGNQQGPAWAVNTSASSSSQPAITIVTSPQASKQLTLDTSATIKEIPGGASDEAPRPQTAIPRQTPSHSRNTSTTSLPPARVRSGTLSSLSSWMPWNARNANLESSAETRLREVLLSSQNCERPRPM